MKKILSALVVILLCRSLPAQEAKTTSPVPVPSAKEYAVLWQQTAAEYRALCYQAFNLAILRLNEIPKRKARKGNLAIVTDLDETILDNSYHEAQLIKEGKAWSAQSWKDWTDRAAATAVPGAVAFLQEAAQKGFTIFYISNRHVSETESTLINLQKLQLPFADSVHLLLMSDASTKEPRRQAVMKQYNIVMLLGDNLNDFTTAFEKKSITGRLAETDQVKDAWGHKFIMLPNPVYGEWENALYNYEKGLTEKQKEKKRMALLKGIQ